MESRLLKLLGTAVAAVGLIYGLAGYPLLEPDEGRNAEVAREMAQSGDFVLPRLNGLPYLDKPILYFAATAVAMRVLGPTPTAARLTSLTFTLLTIAAVAWFAAALFGREAAWIAGMASAASPFTIAYARTVIFDSALTLWVTVALIGSYFAVEGRKDMKAVGSRPTALTPSHLPPWGWAAVGWIAIALGVLTKGPIALALPLMITIPYAVWRGRLAALFDPVGVLAFVALLIPWILAVSQRVPDFLEYALVVETAERLTTDHLGRTAPVWYFFPILLGAALPWTVAAAVGSGRGVFRDQGGWDRRGVFLVGWIVIPLLFFTLSQSKRPQYILPLVPAVALLVAHLWTTARGRLPGATAAGAVLALFGGGLILARGWIAALFDTTPDVVAAIPVTAQWLGVACLVGATFATVLARRRDWVVLGLALPVAVIPLVATPLMHAIGQDRSSAALADAIRPVLTSETEIVAVETYPLSLAFYLRRSLILATRDGRELTSNYIPRRIEQLRRFPNSPLRPADWWREALALCDVPRLFVVRPDDAAAREHLRLAVPLLVTGSDAVVYGPCGKRDLALVPD